MPEGQSDGLKSLSLQVLLVNVIKNLAESWLDSLIPHLIPMIPVYQNKELGNTYHMINDIRTKKFKNINESIDSLFWNLGSH